MKQEHFIKVRGENWSKFSDALVFYERIRPRTDEVPPNEFVLWYRQMARDLAIARSRNYSNDLVSRLNELTVRGHNVVYVNRSGWLAKFLNFLVNDFPIEFRRQKWSVLASTCMFLVPAVFVGFLISENNHNVYAFLDTSQIAEIEAMYKPDSANFGRPENVGSRVDAFAFYVSNNASIGLRMVALGIAFGVGTALFLILNGITLSAIFTHLLVIGYSSTLLPFVAGHSALELTAIVISGAAGIRLGLGLLAPGSMSRREALKTNGREALTLCFGSFLMFLLAAFVEAFFSPTEIPPLTKYIVGATLWILVFLYFGLVGRNQTR